MIVCLRTVDIPGDKQDGFLQWIEKNREVRERHGILLELVLEPSSGDGETVVITAWPSHEIFDEWIATPERDRLTASDVHQAVNYHPLTRYEVAGGYINFSALTKETEA